MTAPRMLLILLLSLIALPAFAAPLTHVTFVTDWKAQAEQGGFYEALALGLYRQRGLDVKIIEGGPSVNVPQMLAGHAADMGIGSNSFIPLNMVKAGIPVRAVMAVFQKDPQVLITHPRQDIQGLADMKGRPIMISDEATVTFWPWLKAKFGFSDTQIRKYTFNLAPFLVDPQAIQEGYLTSEPYTIKMKGHFSPKVFLLADYGYPGYANMVLARQDWIDGKTDAVQGFVDATQDGWKRYLTGDPGPANALIKRANPDMTDAVIAQAIAKMKAYGLVQGGDAKALGIGAMAGARWKTFFDTMRGIGLYPAALDYQKAYDLRFMRNTPQYFN